MMLAELERHLINIIVKKHSGNLQRAADELGISLRGLFDRRKSYLPDRVPDDPTGDAIVLEECRGIGQDMPDAQRQCQEHFLKFSADSFVPVQLPNPFPEL